MKPWLLVITDKPRTRALFRDNRFIESHYNRHFVRNCDKALADLKERTRFVHTVVVSDTLTERFATEYTALHHRPHLIIFGADISSPRHLRIERVTDMAGLEAVLREAERR
jgi:hypothetical protein